MPRHNSSGHGRPGRNLSQRARMQRGVDRRAREDLEPTKTRPRSGAHGVVMCPSGKTGFSKGVAEERLAKYATQEGYRGRRPVRVYECPKCGAWHLTSRPAPPPVES